VTPDPSVTVSVRWLEEHLGAPGLRVLDASWYLPADERDTAAEFGDMHIPGARFFDIDALSDRDSDLPHMLPSSADFTRAMRRLGINGDDHIVVYDSAGLFSAPRAWWMFRVFGHERVSVLDGGLPAWRAAGNRVTSSADDGGAASTAGDFTATEPDSTLLRSLDQVREAVGHGSEQILDARSAARFRGLVAEPRPGVRAGHMPGALNLHYAEVVDAESKTLLPPEALLACFQEAGVDLQRPVLTSCGSGISACLLSLALRRAAGVQAPVYDGSWAEWGRDESAPVTR
jgi:thiosulfate/3-mercaptopyruvate sulfurtransferase